MIPVLHRAQEKQAPPGIGVEIDVWLTLGPATVVSHDPPKVTNHLFYQWLRDDVRRAGFRPLYAVNCKTDGLENDVASCFDRLGVPRDRWFALDMSHPSQKAFAKAGLPFAERVSEEEPWRGHSKRIWLDRWMWGDNAVAFLKGGMSVSRTPGVGLYLPPDAEVHVVSVELHVQTATWVDRVQWWKWLIEEVRPVSICTDYPDELLEVLGSQSFTSSSAEHGFIRFLAPPSDEPRPRRSMPAAPRSEPTP